MSIFNIFKKKNFTNNAREEEDSISLDIHELFDTPLEKRDDFWKKQFNTSLRKHGFSKLNPEIVEDKTGMKYLNLNFNSDEPSNSLEYFVNACLDNGVGIAIKEDRQNHEWYFTYGELLDFSLNGVFYSDKISEPFTGKITDRYISDREASVGIPSERYLPANARKHINFFLSTFNLLDVRIALIWWRDNNRLTLAFNIVSEQLEDTENLKTLLHFIRWYLPNQYDIMFIKGTEDFIEL